MKPVAEWRFANTGLILLKNVMQQIGKKQIASRLRKASPRVKIPPSLSTFNLVHRFGKVEIVHVEREKPAATQGYFKIPDFPGWCMPEQPMGYIKCKKYDFF